MAGGRMNFKIDNKAIMSTLNHLSLLEVLASTINKKKK